MKNLIFLLYLLSICLLADAQQVYTYILTDGWQATKAFDYGDDTCVIVGLVSEPNPSTDHRFHFTTINGENEILKIDTFKLPDSDFVSYQSPFGVYNRDDTICISGWFSSNGSYGGMNAQFDRQNKYISSFQSDLKSISYRSYQTESIRKENSIFIYGGYGSKNDSTTKTFISIKDIKSENLDIYTFDAKNLLSKYGKTHMLPLQIIESNNGFILVNRIKPMNHPFVEIYQGLIIKVDSVGTEQWRLPIWEDSTTVYDLVVAPLANGNFLAMYQDFYYQPDKPPGNTNKFYPAANLRYQPWFVEFNEEGQIVSKWNIRKELEKKGGVQDAYNARFSHYLVEEDGSILCVGSSRDNGKYGYDVGFLLKLDKNGQYLWYRQYELSIATPYNGGKENIFSYGITALKNGGYALAGEYRSDPSDSFPNGTQRGLALFVDSFGCMEPGCHVNDKVGIEESRPFHSAQDDFFLYPNPSNGVLEIRSKLSKVKIKQVDVYDMQGRKVNFSLSGNQVNIDNPAGIYYLRIRRDDGLSKVHKVIIR